MERAEKNVFKIGDKAIYKRVFSEQDLLDFAKLSGDTNRVHMDKEYGRKSRFGANIVHEYLVTSMFSRIIGMQLPGEGSIYLSQSVCYKKPVYINEEITAIVKVKEIYENKM